MVSSDQNDGGERAARAAGTGKSDGFDRCQRGHAREQRTAFSANANRDAIHVSERQDDNDVNNGVYEVACTGRGI